MFLAFFFGFLVAISTKEDLTKISISDYYGSVKISAKETQLNFINKNILCFFGEGIEDFRIYLEDISLFYDYSPEKIGIYIEEPDFSLRFSKQSNESSFTLYYVTYPNKYDFRKRYYFTTKSGSETNICNRNNILEPQFTFLIGEIRETLHNPEENQFLFEPYSWRLMCTSDIETNSYVNVSFSSTTKIPIEGLYSGKFKTHFIDENDFRIPSNNNVYHNLFPLFITFLMAFLYGFLSLYPFSTFKSIQIIVFMIMLLIPYFYNFILIFIFPYFFDWKLLSNFGKSSYFVYIILKILSKIFYVPRSFFSAFAFYKLFIPNLLFVCIMLVRFFLSSEDEFINANLFFFEITSVFYFMMVVIVNDTVSKYNQKDCFIDVFNRKNDPNNVFKV